MRRSGRPGLALGITVALRTASTASFKSASTPSTAPVRECVLVGRKCKRLAGQPCRLLSQLSPPSAATVDPLNESPNNMPKAKQANHPERKASYHMRSVAEPRVGQADSTPPRNTCPYGRTLRPAADSTGRAQRGRPAAPDPGPARVGVQAALLLRGLTHGAARPCACPSAGPFRAARPPPSWGR